MKKLNFRKVVCAIMVVTACCFTQVNAFALSDGAYTADTLTHYLNPDTGKTDDGGTGNAEIGEGMCRSVVYPKALIEQKNGKTWITVRILLYSNLSNARVYTQDLPKGNYTEVKHTVMSENSPNDSGDFRFEVPSADCYVKTKMYVEPMGRDVCFYWKVDTSTAQSGNADFIKTIKTGASEATKGEFTDISSHWAKKDIESVVAKKLFSGTSDTTFSPDTAMTRGMFVTVLGRLSGEDVSAYSSAKFTDVNSTQYYAKYIGWANANGFVSGISETIFSPDTPVTCEQASAIMLKYAQKHGVTLKTDGTEPEMKTVSNWAMDSVEKAGKVGFITSQNTNGYKFTSSATRADVASIIMNYANSYAK